MCPEEPGIKSSIPNVAVVKGGGLKGIRPSAPTPPILLLSFSMHVLSRLTIS